MPLEPGRIGQDRQAGRAAGLIGAGVIGWIKIFSYQSLGWRSFLYLCDQAEPRSEEHTSELQSLMRISYAVFCLKKTNNLTYKRHHDNTFRLTTQPEEHIN